MCRATRRRTKQIGRGPTCDHPVRDRVGVLLVRVASFSHTAVKTHTIRLLNDVCCFVSGHMEIGLAPEHDVITGRERLRALGLRGIAADMRLDLGDVVLRAEGRLDLIDERQCRRGGRNAACGSVVNRGRGGGASWGALQLNVAHGVGQRALSRRDRRGPAVRLAEFLGH
jgi:hypothetical protein